MSVPAENSAVPDDRGRRLATWSLLMLPMLLLSAIAAGVFGMFMLGRRDLEGSEPMSVQGGYGWMVWAISTIILMIPPAVGLGLGLTARRLGAKGTALAGILVNGLILIGYPIVSLIGLLRQ
jgi:hypothetical protein